MHKIAKASPSHLGKQQFATTSKQQPSRKGKLTRGLSEWGKINDFQRTFGETRWGFYRK